MFNDAVKSRGGKMAAAVSSIWIMHEENDSSELRTIPSRTCNRDNYHCRLHLAFQEGLHSYLRYLHRMQKGRF